MKILLIGYGSIAKKHLKALKDLSIAYHIYALRSEPSDEVIENMTNIRQIQEAGNVDFIMVCNPTFLHATTLESVLHLRKPIFLEKPPFSKLGKDENELIIKLKSNDIPVYCAFNMRYLASLMYLKSNVVLYDVQEVNIYCGSYLPDWRQGVDYKKNYSANAAQGGGVHLDLIHEIDYATWLFGTPNSVSCIKSSNSKLEIDAIDYANYNLQYNSFNVNIILNYYRREAKRTIEVVNETNILTANLITNIVTQNDGAILYESSDNVIDTYKSQMQYFLNLVKNGFENDYSFENSISVLKIALT